MNEDPLMPAASRFPRDAWPPSGSEEQPSAVRPYILRGAQHFPAFTSAKHRTAPHQTPHTNTTTNDGEQLPDTWYEPDD